MKGLHMQLQKEVKKEPNARISIQATVDRATVNEERENIIKDFENSAKIPGFRKGRVPRNLVLMNFSDSIKSKTIQKLLTSSIDQIIGEDQYRPISEPVVTEMGDLSLDEDFSFKAEFDVMPEIKLAEYRGVASEKYVYKVSDDIVDKEIQTLRERFATLLSVDKKTAIGDYVVLDYEETTEDGGSKNKKEDQTILLDNKTDELTKQLVGLEKEEEKDISITSSTTEDGKEQTITVNLHVRVKDVKKKELPELDDDFAKDISDVETLEDLKENIRKQLEEEAGRRSDSRTRDELVIKIMEKTEFEMPETLVNQETDRLMSEISTAYRIDLKKLQADDEKYKEYRKNMRPKAINNLKYNMILDEVADKENIDVADNEIDEEIKKFAENSKKDFQTLKNTMIENKTLDNLRYRLKLDKALELIYKNAKLDKLKKLNYGEEEENK